MKKIFTIAMFLMIFGFSFSYAQDSNNNRPNPDSNNNKPVVTTPAKTTQTYQRLQNPIKVNSIEAVILLAVDIAIYIGVSFAILAIIFVGFKFVMAQGKPEAIKKAQDWLLWIVIGLAVLISARVIVEIVKNTLVESGVVNENVFKKP